MTVSTGKGLSRKKNFAIAGDDPVTIRAMKVSHAAWSV